MEQVIKFERRIARERLARKEAEELVDRKSLELYNKNKELKKLSESLEKVIAQRTSQMQKARDDALNALKVKSEFIANMSHELRTPMNGVLGILSLLRDDDLTDSQRELVEIAQTSGEHLLMVINDVLDFSKIEANKLNLNIGPIELREYIKAVCKPFELQSEQKGVSFEYSIDDEVPDDIKSDKLRLTQILTNLLSNAVKFTKQGFVKLSVSLPNSDDKSLFRICVQDSGIGISKDKISSVFSAFEQADSSITREFGGTGLGMNITQRLVNKLGGTISLESELSKGTSFYVDLTVEAIEKPIGKLNPNLEPKEIDGGLQVLLVEDNQINQLVAMRILQNWGLNVSVAENGQIAIEMLSEKSYDMIFMDLQMPVKGGIETCYQIRRDKLVPPSTPIIAMTAHNGEEHVKECFDAGMQGHIAKPLDRSALKAQVDKYVKISNAAEHSNISHEQEEVPGIDLSDGLNRLNDDRTLLYSLIRNFLNEYSGLSSKLFTLMEQSNLKEAQELLHKIKGSSSNLGMKALSKLAGDLEQQLKNERAISAAQINSMQRQYDIVVKSFATLDVLEEVELSGLAQRNESNEYLQQKMSELLSNLSKDLQASEEALKDLQACVLNDETARYLDQANEAMQIFDIASVEEAVKCACDSIK